MNIKSTLVNEYTVGGSLLLVGFGFFSTRFADVLSYRLTTLPSMIPVIGGATVTVGRILGIVPATLGLAVLFRKARDIPVVSEATELPLLKTIVNYVEDLSDEMGETIEVTPAIIMDLSAEEFSAEQLLLCAEHDDYFSACGCGSESTESVEMAADSWLGRNKKGELETVDVERNQFNFKELPTPVDSHINYKKQKTAKKPKKTTGSPKQQAWRSSVAEAKGDMAKAKQLYAAKGY